MFPVDRALLIINRAAGSGQGDLTVGRLTTLFRQTLRELSEVQVELVNDHATARTCAAQFSSASAAPALVVAGGGGGTLRAVIEGICDSQSSTVRVGALRMGSGNVLARQFGVPRDPFIALQGVLANLGTGRTAPCCVMRCETWTSSGTTQVHHAVTLGGLGHFGRIPSDLSRWHTRFPLVQRLADHSIGVEKLTNVEYAVAFLLRTLTHRTDTVEIQFQNQQQRLRLLSGVVMNFPIAALPFKPRVTVEDEALAVYLLSLRGSCRFRIERDQRLDIRFVDRECVEFFLDEDPVTTCGRLSLTVAGSILFVPGPEYLTTDDTEKNPDFIPCNPCPGVTK
jgi:diacylglycerol kinase family enzyme